LLVLPLGSNEPATAANKPFVAGDQHDTRPLTSDANVPSFRVAERWFRDERLPHAGSRSG